MNSNVKQLRVIRSRLRAELQERELQRYTQTAYSVCQDVLALQEQVANLQVQCVAANGLPAELDSIDYVVRVLESVADSMNSLVDVSAEVRANHYGVDKQTIQRITG